MNKFYFAGIIVGMLVVGNTSKASAAVINFDDQGLVGPSYFDATTKTQEINVPTTNGNVRFSGGAITTSGNNIPADQTSAYATTSFGDSSLTNPLTVTFEHPVQNFYLDVLNGNTENIDYTVADNAGNSSTFTLPPNLNSGQKQIGFAATGTQVTIKSAKGSSIPYDFLIDNIHFDEPLPPTIPSPTTMTSVPEPNSAFGTLAFGALGGGLIIKRKMKKQNPAACRHWRKVLQDVISQQ
jgi:hypothetical protein